MQFSKSLAEAGKIAEIAKDNMKGRKGGTSCPPLGMLVPPGNSFAEASVQPPLLAWGSSHSYCVSAGAKRSGCVVVLGKQGFLFSLLQR